MKTIQKDWEIKQNINIETDVKKTKRKRENMEKTDIVMSEEKKEKLKECQKNYREAKTSQYNNK